MSKNKKNEQNKSPIEKISPLIFIVITGLFFGCLLIIMDEVYSKGDLEDILVPIIGLVVLYISMYIQIIIHELGHLIFGLMSKYEFVSFRIGNLMLIKIKNKFKIKKYKIVGTSGQCLMSPPELVDNKIPVILYNLGGTLLNLIISTLSFIIAHYTKSPTLSYSLQIFGLVGMLCAAQNGIPMKTAEINNDGLNAISLSKHPEAQKAFWIQLKINAETSSGKRYKDMPAEWFEMPNDKDMKNTMIATLGVGACSYMLEQHNFEEANKAIKHLLKIKSGLIGIHKNLLIVDQIYCELINENFEEAKKLLTPSLKNFMLSMKDYPSIIRTEYTIALLLDKDQNKANEIKKKFILRGKTYPYSADIKSEKELIDIATNISKN